MSNDWRKSHHPLLPLQDSRPEPGDYHLYPSFPLERTGDGSIAVGFAGLADRIMELLAEGRGCVSIDGGSGIMWDRLAGGLRDALEEAGVNASFVSAGASLRSREELEDLIAPHLGGNDPLFGTRYTGQLRDFFQHDLPGPGQHDGVTVLYGSGAALFEWPGPLVYLAVPRNEEQYRLRAGSVAPLGGRVPQQPEPKPAYKRLFFVDWPVLEAHVAAIAPAVDLYVDTQDPYEPRTVKGGQLRATLAHMAASPFRVRPWFEIGPWGGQWLKEQVKQLPREEINYAWSFELITPENGLLLSDGERQLEVGFEWLMALESAQVLGEAQERFGRHFPIRFNYLDTVRGGNLSVQVHPSSDYVRRHFGHGLTQDETYYVVSTRDGEPEPVIYLGFRDGVDSEEFTRALEHSAVSGQELDVDRFVNTVPAVPHGLYLIPNGTIHSAGEGSLVLEISATTYLFTMKLYDWQRLDVDGRPRPLNLERGLANLDYSRTSEVIEAEHISRPVQLDAGEGWRLEHLPTHERHFFDVHRLALEPGVELELDTGNRFHVLNVVEGQHVHVTGLAGEGSDFSYAETFVVPAATGRYRIRNTGAVRALLVKAFVKRGRGAWSTYRGIMEP